MSYLYNLKAKCVLNGVGLYSKEQVEELTERGDELWKALNHVYSGLQVYINVLEQEMECFNVSLFQGRHLFTSILSFLPAIDQLTKCMNSAHEVLFRD